MIFQRIFLLPKKCENLAKFVLLCGENAYHSSGFRIQRNLYSGGNLVNQVKEINETLQFFQAGACH